MSNKFEKMLELLINEDKAAAEELFHEIVVEKSRDIYESILEGDHDEEHEEEEDEEEGMKENYFFDEAEDDDMDDDMFGDDEDMDDEDMGDEDMGDEDMGDEDMGDEDMGDEETEERITDLEDALDDLKREFEQLMSKEDMGDEEEEDMGGDETDDMIDDMGPEEEDMEKESFDELQQMREYVEKVAGVPNSEKSVNAKSTVAGKNDMGGHSTNIAQGGEENGGDHAGLADIDPKDMGTDNVNVPGGKASKSMKPMTKGHGAEKKGSAPAKADAESPIKGR